MMEQKFDLPSMVSSFCFHLHSNYTQGISKIYLRASGMESVERRKSSVIIKIFFILFFYIMDQQIDPPT